MAAEEQEALKGRLLEIVQGHVGQDTAFADINAEDNVPSKVYTSPLYSRPLRFTLLKATRLVPRAQARFTFVHVCMHVTAEMRAPAFRWQLTLQIALESVLWPLRLYRILAFASCTCLTTRLATPPQPVSSATGVR